MKKVLLLTSIIAFSFINIYAQEFDFKESNTSPPSFIVWNIEGTAKYLEEGSSTSQKIVSGMILSETGTVILNKKSQLKLSCNDQTVTFHKKGTYSLKNEAKKLADLSNNSPVLDDFLVEMGAASGFGDTGADGDGGRESGTAQTDTAGGSGWGTRKSIDIIMPIGGIVPLQSITFSWAGISEDGFRIKVFADSKQLPVFSAVTKNNSFTVDVAQLTINEGKECTWEVENVSDPNIKSERIPISFIDKGQDMEVIQGLKSDKAYSNSDSWLKLLREAHALQKENMLYTANEKYQQGLKEFSDNLTIKKMYARYLTNNGLEAFAETVIK